MNSRPASRRLVAILPLLLATWACSEEVSTPTAVDGVDVQFAKGGQGKSDPVVQTVVPDEGLQGQTLDIEVGGEGFEAGDEVLLGINGQPVDEIITNGTSFVSSEALSANITIDAGTEVGDYDVIVRGRGGRKGIGTALFQVKLGPHANAFVTDLGSLGSGDFRSAATDINDSGEIVGWSLTESDGRHAVYWDAGLMRSDLGPGWAEAINNYGQIVGHYHTPSGEQRGFVLVLDDPETRIDLAPLPGHTVSMARDINDWGQVVGESRATVTGAPTGVIWDAGTGAVRAELQGLSSGSSRPFAINSAGHVVGVSPDASGVTQAVFWLDAAGPPIALSGGEEYGYAYGLSAPTVDDVVYVAGQRGVSGDYRATVWTVDVSDGSLNIQEEYDLASSSYAFDVNTKGEAVGDIGPNRRAYLWRVSGGTMEALELGSVVGRASSSANAINEGGLIVGWSQVSTKGKNKGLEHAVLWRF